MTRCLPTLLVCATLLFEHPCSRAAGPASEALATPVTADWTGLPLRQAAGRLSEIGGIAVVVDRRLDPEISITLHATSDPLDEVLARVADAARADVAVYASHVRLVPRGGAAALATAERFRAEELKHLGTSLRDVVARKAAWSWPDGAVPRELLASAAEEAGIRIEGLEHLPHDHFPAARLPAGALADRLDLLLAHFDKRVAWKPLPRRPGEQPAFLLVDLPAGVPEPPATPQKPSPRPPRAPARPASTTYTLTVAAPLDELLTTLARRFDLTLDLDRAALTKAGVAPAEIVRLELKDASREQLLEAICKPRGLAWRIEGDTLSISAVER